MEKRFIKFANSVINVNHILWVKPVSYPASKSCYIVLQVTGHDFWEEYNSETERDTRVNELYNELQ